jgi:hypothetical protein
MALGRSRGGGSISTQGTAQGKLISVDVVIAGIDKTTAEFKAIRKDINSHIRDVMTRVGEQELLPTMRADFPRLTTPTKKSQVGMMAASLYVQRERSGVFIGSRLRGPKNRALGWIDFGGKRPRDRAARQGPKVIVKTLDSKRALIDSRVLQELEREFRAINNP